MKKIVLAAILLLPLQFVFAGELGITVSNGMAKVSWPLTNYFSLLQSSTNLTASNSWSNIGSASLWTAIWPGRFSPVLTNFVGDKICHESETIAAPKFFRLTSPTYLPVFGFAIFYEPLLELSASSSLTISGPVHANSSIYTGPLPSVSQIFNGVVTVGGTVSSPDNAGYVASNWTGAVVFNGQPAIITNMPQLTSRTGTNNPHAIIEIPPVGEDPNSALGFARLYNHAEMILIVTNTPAAPYPTVTVILQRSSSNSIPGSDPFKVLRILTNASPAYVSTNGLLPLPFLSLTNTFTDQREHQTNMFVTQIDLQKFSSWVQTNWVVTSKLYLLGVTKLYVADRRHVDMNKLAVVRLVKGARLPFDQNFGIGFTVATQNPLYVWGDYNITVNSNTFATTLGSTTNGASIPAALIADAITILSPNWSDAASAASYTTRNATSMTVNAAFLCGNVPSTGASSSTFSGGVQNLTRFLENWSGDTLTYNTSLVCLFASQMATNPFVSPQSSGAYYAVPTRLWGFDVNFTNIAKLPPGTPAFGLP